jgi:hypothetical protein
MPKSQAMMPLVAAEEWRHRGGSSSYLATLKSYETTDKWQQDLG